MFPKYLHDYSIKDMFICLNSFFKDYSKLMNNKLKGLFNNSFFLFLDSGRSALNLTLKSLKLPKNSEVVVPVNVCKVVMDAIIKNGLKPLLIDISNDLTISTEDLSRKISKKTKVIIIVHTYGNICDMKKISKISKKYNCFLIEDMAQTFHSVYDGKPIGTFGDAAFISLDVTKYICAFKGGILITKDKALFRKIKAMIKKRENIFTDIRRMLNLFGFVLISNKVIYTIFTHRLIPKIKGFWFYPPKNKYLSKVGVALAYSQLLKLNKITKNKTRNAKLFISMLKKNKNIEIYSKAKKSSFLFLPIGISNKQEVEKALSRYVDLPQPVPLLTKIPEFRKYCLSYPNADRIDKKLLLLPTYGGIKKRQKIISEEILKLTKKS